jgi:hypothetical protein
VNGNDERLALQSEGKPKGGAERKKAAQACFFLPHHAEQEHRNHPKGSLTGHAAVMEEYRHHSGHVGRVAAKMEKGFSAMLTTEIAIRQKVLFCLMIENLV